YTALSWVVSQGIRGLDTGRFVVIPNAEYRGADTELDFSLLPHNSSTCTIEYDGKKLTVSFNVEENNNNNDNGQDTRNDRKDSPTIVLASQVRDDVDVAWMNGFLKKMYKEYHEYEQNRRERGRWELDGNANWFYVLKSHTNQGLDSVVLAKEQEDLLK